MTILRPMTHEQFLHLCRLDPYYSGRWPYFETVIRLAMKQHPRSVLELGCYRVPLISGSDTMDLRNNLAKDKVTYKWDARRTPWPVSRRYDLFLAMQVWEHLEPQQGYAFDQVRRISRRAILTFPYLWQCNNKSDCHHAIDLAKIRRWTRYHKMKARVRVKLPNPKRQRLVCLFEF